MMKETRPFRDQAAANPLQRPPIDSHRSNRFAAILLYIVVAAAPLPFGSTEPAVIAFWCLCLGIALVATTPSSLSNAQLSLFGLVACVLLGYVCVLHEQLATNPWVASPHPIWKSAEEALGLRLNASVSITKDQPFFSLGSALGNLLILLCSYVICADRHRARQLLLVVAWSGAVYAVFGIASFLIAPHRLLWVAKRAYTDSLTSTFVNRNTAAIYFGTCSIVWLLLLFERTRRVEAFSFRASLSLSSSAVLHLPRDVLTAAGLTMLCLAAMFMTNSRAGSIFSLLGCLIASIGFHLRDLNSIKRICASLAIAFAALAILFVIMGGNVSGRFDFQSLRSEERFATYQSVLQMIRDHPWLGTGLGTFATAFTAYRSGDVSVAGVWDKAHNTLLELASEVGVPLTAIIILVWSIGLGLLTRGMVQRRRDQIFSVAALAVALIALGHSLVDFSLQIPGYSLIVFALVGAGIAQSFPSRVRQNIVDG
jgi:O-antigen ligase